MLGFRDNLALLSIQLRTAFNFSATPNAREPNFCSQFGNVQTGFVSGLKSHVAKDVSSVLFGWPLMMDGRQNILQQFRACAFSF
jgi:hypothetical protein